jgi:membrane protein involved in colicin uptake
MGRTIISDGIHQVIITISIILFIIIITALITSNITNHIIGLTINRGGALGDLRKNL